ncbi:TerD family protein [Quadrisphaera setariae]|uniref:Tellurium resistance protein n=1 Tax=Quadrisphaera setariae TaxID=2593304 RepID=A0A5C8ZHY0_9ACTN|nr:tellurium resistance protein [Quadrisphaera setariae]TXR56480.1 tellurium resistance protein [Quadrisphaera setariae]
MPIDYTKRPAQQPPAPQQAAGSTTGQAPRKVTLTKSAPTISLTKRAGAGGVLRVNLSWTARSGDQGGFFRRREPDIDLDLGCLYEFTDGSKGVVQALGGSFRAGVAGVPTPVVWLDGDDRSGTREGGENLHVDLAHSALVRRVLVFAYIYEGTPNWAGANGVVTLTPPEGPQVEVLLDEPRAGARTCAIALLTPSAGALSVQREVRYVDGAQPELDAAYGWGMRWTSGRK